MSIAEALVDGRRSIKFLATISSQNAQISVPTVPYVMIIFGELVEEVYDAMHVECLFTKNVINL